MEKVGKVWGTTTEFFKNQFLSFHLLRIKAGGFCSEHRHWRKWNLFFCIEGTVVITTWPTDGSKKKDETTLHAGDSASIEPRIWHRFQAKKDSVIVEVYEAASIEEDIERRSVGGVEGTLFR